MKHQKQKYSQDSKRRFNQGEGRLRSWRAKGKCQAVALAVCAVALALSTSGVHASSIGAKFLGRNGGDTTIQPGDTAGVVPQTQWFTIDESATGFVGKTPPLTDSGTNFTTVQIEFAANDSWNTGSPNITPDDRLMKGCLKGSQSSLVSLSFTNLGAGPYDVYVYCAVNNGPVELNLWIGSTTNYVMEPNDWGGTFIQSASTDPNVRAEGNYVKYTGVTPVGGGINVRGNRVTGGDGSGITGLQIVGSFPPNTIPVAIADQPKPIRTVAGSVATFSVGVTGPSKFQWYKDGNLIPEATASTYTTPGLTALDDNSKYKVICSNNLNSLTSDEVAITIVADTGARVSLSFSEWSGVTTTNTGFLWGNGAFAVRGFYPTYSTKVPTGAFSPTANNGAVDFGTIGPGQGGRAIDFGSSEFATPGSFTAFTITGWLNCRDLREGGGGNRILFAEASGGGQGFELVQRDDGSLALGVNGWSDGPGARGTAGRITADPNAGAANWVFFAATYDGASVSYYFGSPSTAAALVDDKLPYYQGPIAVSGRMTIGNFSSVVAARNDSGPTGSRCFRGLIDEVNIFGQALTLAEIRAQQTAPAYVSTVVKPVVITQDPMPANQTVFVGQTVTYGVSFVGSGPLSVQWRKNGTPITVATNATYTFVATLGDDQALFSAGVTNSIGGVTSAAAKLTVVPEDNHKVFLSFSEGQGTTTANLGNIGGVGNIVQQGGFPVFSSMVPVGSFAPANNTSSLNMGVIGDTDGGRAIDFVGSVTPTIGPMTAFTVTGWLNCQDLRYGSGGNRIFYCQTALNTGGFDLTQQADGLLWMGVNQWPDGSPNSPCKSVTVLTEDPNLGNANWVFFAFTYDGSIGTQNASFYFGKPDQAATLDSTFDYDMGPISLIGNLTIANFSTVDNGARNGTGPNGGSRNFRGLMDELSVYSKALTLAEIQVAQKATPGVPHPASPSLAASLQGKQVVITWSSTSSFQLQKRETVNAGAWINETTAPVVNGNLRTVTLPNSGSALFFRLISN